MVIGGLTKRNLKRGTPVIRHLSISGQMSEI